ncbi:hypothetical protein GGE45_002641 [Rhizobium aethiopicum]|uniref:Uncharacterized protein n=1 Tax=Rhizobium aethiopicum TaxID=1138170 RepID=A0A7W6Q7V8_9HYPH|nr:hypothetical protein [Rhizobium aethiopicum]MBB4580311.1 hypothetical protein [Rhizobium aethiopicum]
MREHKEAERQHPETEDRQETQQSTENEGRADCHSPDA